jgi:hypothetical protein
MTAIFSARGATGTLTPLLTVIVLMAACGESKPTLPEPQKSVPESSAVSSPPEMPALPADPDHLGNVPMEVDTVAGASSFTTKGTGDCTFTGDAAIYDAPAAMWHATLRAEGQSVSYVNATVWQFKDRTPTQVAVGVQLGPRFRHISTVKGSALIGTGTATTERSGNAATITVDGRDEKGTVLALRIRCAKVTTPVEEGRR